MRNRTTLRWVFLAALGAGSGACATAIQGSADNISRLEAARTANPNSQPALRTLGIAYYKANRLPEARSALQRSSEMKPDDGVAALYLGIVAEAQNDIPAAKAAYTSYSKVGRTRGVRNQIQARLDALAKREVVTQAKQAIQQETQLATVAGSPQTVAVLPFRYTGSDTTLVPLERGFAELITTDLSRSARLTVVDRTRIQALLDELALQRSGVVSDETRVRAGKIIQAGRMVGGDLNLDGNQLRARADVIDVQTTGIVGVSPTNTQTLEQLFTLEKNIVLALFDNLGIQLLTAERNAIEQRPTRNLQAFLSYSRGLAFEDQGRFDDASRMYQDAVRQDPSFTRAQQKSTEVRNIVTGNQVSAATVESGLRGTSEGAAVAAATGGSVTSSATGGGVASLTAQDLNPSVAQTATSGAGVTGSQPARDPSSGTGGDNPTTKTAKVTITISDPARRP